MGKHTVRRKKDKEKKELFWKGEKVQTETILFTVFFPILRHIFCLKRQGKRSSP